MATVTFSNATRRYAKGSEPAVNSFNLEIKEGEFLVLVGPSGCGKSTTLRMLAGLEPVNEGAIFIDGQDVTDVSPADRDVAMVFQNYALYPNMTVRQNMSFALENKKMPKDQIAERVAEAARILQLEEYLDRKPAHLSGGQRQRVAMGRAIVREPAVFCMDEPLSNLDAKLRVSTRAQISELQRRLGTTTVYVTHDQTEAMTMGDRVAVLKEGELQQVAPTRELYDNPANVFVAGFIGSPAMNVYTVPVKDGQAELGPVRIPLIVEPNSSAPGLVKVGIRPEDFHVGEESTPGSVPLEVTHIEELGHESYIYGVITGAASIESATHMTGATGVLAHARTTVSRGETIYIVPDLDRVHLFDEASGERLN